MLPVTAVDPQLLLKVYTVLSAEYLHVAPRIVELEVKLNFREHLNLDLGDLELQRLVYLLGAPVRPLGALAVVEEESSHALHLEVFVVDFAGKVD